ncbi:MAG TPA: SDR family NAD(P)-dependent oxidoreductase [Bacteroidales bacterium]|nr:SDR family NAD(P)-dependent oxidoreductase [Bacteroidales bacterium]
MELQNKCVLVTGGAGFIGSHLTEMLVARTSKVRVLVHYNSSDRLGWIDHLPADKRDALEIFKGDIRDPNGVREAMKGCQVVFHLAALIGIPYSYHSPDTYVDTNVKGTLNVLQAARHLGLERVIHTSTSEVYGTAQFVPITEEHPVSPQSPYAATKASADFLALSFHRSFGTPVTVVRPFNTYGPRQSTRAIIPSIVTQLISGHDRIRLGSLHPTRDLTFVNDTAMGFFLAAGCDQAIGEVVNLGTGNEISVGDLARKIAGMLGREIHIESDGDRIRPEKSEVERLCAGFHKMHDLSGWKAVTSLDDGLRQTIAWFSDPAHLALYHPGSYTI